MSPTKHCWTALDSSLSNNVRTSCQNTFWWENHKREPPSAKDDCKPPFWYFSTKNGLNLASSFDFVGLWSWKVQFYDLQMSSKEMLKVQAHNFPRNVNAYPFLIILTLLVWRNAAMNVLWVIGKWTNFCIALNSRRTKPILGSAGTKVSATLQKYSQNELFQMIESNCL